MVMGKHRHNRDDGGDGLDTPKPVIARLRLGHFFAIELISHTSSSFLSREESAYTTPLDDQAPNEYKLSGRPR